MIRINKYLASLGIASRRAIDSMVSMGRIELNGKLAIPGDKVNPETDSIKIDGKPLAKPQQDLVYIALNKPENVLSTTTDPQGRSTVLDLVTVPERVFPVGRLDYNSSGLILLTNDGDLSLKLTHPRYHLSKTYLVTVRGRVSPDKIKQLEEGIELPTGKTYQTLTRIFHKSNRETTLKITLYEGKKRQIRLMCAALRLFVVSLMRIQIGPIDLGNLKEGEWRFLTPEEVSLLRS